MSREEESTSIEEPTTKPTSTLLLQTLSSTLNEHEPTSITCINSTAGIPESLTITWSNKQKEPSRTNIRPNTETNSTIVQQSTIDDGPFIIREFTIPSSTQEPLKITLTARREDVERPPTVIRQPLKIPELLEIPNPTTRQRLTMPTSTIQHPITTSTSRIQEHSSTIREPYTLPKNLNLPSSTIIIPIKTPLNSEEDSQLRISNSPIESKYTQTTTQSPEVSVVPIANSSPILATTHEETYSNINYNGYPHSVPSYSAFQPVVQNLASPPLPAIIPSPTDNEEEEEIQNTNIVPININEEENHSLGDKIETDSNNLEIMKYFDFEEEIIGDLIRIKPIGHIADNSMELVEVTSARSLTPSDDEVVVDETFSSTPVSSDIPVEQDDAADISERQDTPERLDMAETLIMLETSNTSEINDIQEIHDISETPIILEIPHDTSFVSNTRSQIHPKALGRSKMENFSIGEEMSTSPPQPFTTNVIKSKSPPKIDITSNVIVKDADLNEQLDRRPMSIPNANIAALISAAEVLNQADEFYEQNENLNNESRPLIHYLQSTNGYTPPIPITNTQNPTDNITFANITDSTYTDQKKILFINNNNMNNNKMLLTITPPNNQNNSILLHRGSNDANPKTPLQTINNKTLQNKVVALKRLHEDNGDENDFENLITENQIYGNKIVVKEKSQGIQQEHKLKTRSTTKNGFTKNYHGNENKNIMQPNFLSVSNVQIPNVMNVKNKNTLQIDNENIIVNDILMPNENSEVQITNEKAIQCSPTAVINEGHLLNNNVIQIPQHIDDSSKPEVIFSGSENIIMNPQVVYHVVDNASNLNTQTIQPIHENQSDRTFSVPKVSAVRKVAINPDEMSALDLYEKRRRIRRLKHLTNREHKKKDPNKNEIKKKIIKRDDSIIKPSDIKAELYIEFCERDLPRKNEGSEDEFDYGDEDLLEYEKIINEYAEKPIDTQHMKKQSDFLSMLNLATPEVYDDKQIDKQDKMLSQDSVASAYISAGQIHKIKLLKPRKRYTTRSKYNRLQLEDYKPNYDNSETAFQKINFLTYLELTCVTAQYRDEFDKVWELIVNDRLKRHGPNDFHYKLLQDRINQDTKEQLELLTEINKSVNENNNLIKKHWGTENSNIHMLTEKNISELNRLSQLADNSVKILSGKDTKMRDLNPGFDSENIEHNDCAQLNVNCVELNIPDVNKMNATVVDEAAPMHWPGVDAIITSYKPYAEARMKEIEHLKARNKQLLTDNFHGTHVTVKDTEFKRRRMFAERNAHLQEEQVLRTKLRKLLDIIDVIRNYDKSNNRNNSQ